MGRGLGGLCPLPIKMNYLLALACFDAFSAVLFVRVLARKMLNFPHEEVIRWTLKMYVVTIMGLICLLLHCCIVMQAI